MNAPDTTPDNAAPVRPPKRLDVASYSGLKELRRSPRHYFEWVTGPEREPTPAMELGTALHALVLEPERFARHFAILPDFGPMQSSTNRAKRDAFMAASPGVTWMKPDAWDKIHRMREAVMAHPLARDLLVAGHPEAEMDWTDADTGLACRGRPDFVVPELGIVLDLKSTDDASPAGFARSVAKFDYHTQAVFYLDGFKARRSPVNRFLFLVVESDEPHAVALYELDDAAMERGAMLVTRDLARLRECVDSNTWPAFGDGIAPLSLPGWAFYD